MVYLLARGLGSVFINHQSNSTKSAGGWGRGPAPSSPQEHLEWNFANPAKSVAFVKNDAVLVSEFIKAGGSPQRVLFEGPRAFLESAPGRPRGEGSAPTR